MEYTDYKNKLEKLLEETYEINKDPFNKPKFVKWRIKCETLIEEIVARHHDIFIEFKRIEFYVVSGVGDCDEGLVKDDKIYYYEGVNKARGILEFFIDEINDGSLNSLINKNKKAYTENIETDIDKVFISHSSKDKEYVDLFVNLLNDIGLRKKENIFYSSNEAYGVPLDKDIYDCLRDELNKNVYVIYMISDNYYNSSACLNEMGATWVNYKENTTILLPNFKYDNLEGAINPRKLGMNINSKKRLGHLKDKIIEMFDLDELEADYWEDKRDKYLLEIDKLIDRDRKSNNLCDVEVEKIRKSADGEIELQLRFINNGNQAVEFTEIDISFEDKNGNEYFHTLDETVLNYHLVRKGENRVDTFYVNFGQTEYNPNRNKFAKCTPYCQTLR